MNVASHQQLSSGIDGSGASPSTAREGNRLAAGPGSPAATRARSRTWKDPRLLVGVAVVAVCVLLGARLFASADDTVAVWAVRTDMPAGSMVDPGDLQPARLRFGSAALAERYVSANGQVPGGLALTRDVKAGELLPRAALGSADQPELAEVPIAVPTEAVPATLRAGQLVDVWVTTPEQDEGGPPRAMRVLQQVRVLAVPSTGGALGPTTTRQVLVGLPVQEQSRLATALASLSNGTAVLVRRD